MFNTNICKAFNDNKINSFNASDEFAIYTGQTKFQMMCCMLKLNTTVWQQKLNTEDIGGQDMCSEWNRKGFPRKA